MPETTGRRVRIESALDADGKTHALHHTRVYVGDEDITNDIVAIDWHADAKSAPTATIQIFSPHLAAEALEAEFARTDGTTPEPETLTKHDLGLHKLALVSQGERITALTDQLAAITQQLGVIFQMQPQCATCAAEARQGQRPNINFVNVIVDGTGYCNDHVDITAGRLRPRGTSGLIIAGG